MTTIDNLNSFDHIIVAYSGGKDSTACVLRLLDLGIDRKKIELWHHLVDGREGSTLMDWPITEDYCRKFAQSLGLPIYFSWLEGGFEREMTKDGSIKAPTWFETPEGLKKAGGIKGKAQTRLKFPQVSADLKVRWCSSYLKIDACSIAINNQDRFNGKKILLVTGERAQESTSRAKYQELEKHKTSNTKKEVWQWRAVHSWSEEQVWEIIRLHGINPHPAYQLGWGRLSCMTCIFGSPNQWASAALANPEKVQKIIKYEQEFGVTIHRSRSVLEQVEKGTPYEMDKELLQAANCIEYNLPIFVSPDNWTLPQGAYGESTGPM